MNLKTYRARTMADALTEVKRDLGKDAVILHTRSYKAGGWLLGLGAKPMVEITASNGVNVANPLQRRAKAQSLASPVSPPPASAVSTAYGIGSRPLASRAAGPQVTYPTFPAVPAATMVPEGHVEASRAADLNIAATEVARMVVRNPAVPAIPAGPSVEQELAAIKRIVSHVLQTTRQAALQTAREGNGGVGGGSSLGLTAMPEALLKLYLKLLEGAVAAEIADEVIGAVRDELTGAELAEESIVRQTVLRRLAAMIPVAGDVPLPNRANDGRPLTIALVGPTGVGKTTTVAKLAATYKLRHGKRVGLVTSDTYRIAAVDQLRTYANIIGLPLKVPMTPGEMASACASLRDCDIILIDTAGRSQNDAERIEELRQFIDAARPHETHLVLSSAASESVLVNAAKNFAPAGADRVIFTKLDEAVNFGMILTVARRIELKLSYVTTGQEVPDHIEVGRADRLARLVLDGEPVR